MDEGTTPREFRYFGAEDLIALHALVFDVTHQQATDRLRSRPVLEGAAGRPRQHAHYGAADLADQAAVLAHGIAEGQPFVDGNKRTALVCLVAFLELNGRTIAAPEAQIADRIYRLSQALSAEEFGARVRTHLVELT